MPFNCLIPNCVRTCKKSLFRVPSNMKQREKWIELIQSAYPNIKIPKIFLVCEDHFNKDYISRKNVIKDSDGNIIFERELLKTKLKDGANPCFTCSQELVEDIRSNEDSSDVTLPMNQDNEENLIESSRSNHDSSDVKNLVEENVTVSINTSISSPVSLLFELQSTSSMYCKEQGLLIEKQKIFQDLLSNKIQFNLPDITWGCHRNFELHPQILFTQASMSKEKKMIIIKQVTIYEDLQYNVLFLNKEALSGQYILENLDDVDLLLEHVHNFTLCQGGPVINHFKDTYPLCAIQDNITNTWRHKKCPVQTSGEKICKFCVSLYKSLQQNADRNKHRTSKKIVLTPSSRKKVIALRAAKRVKVQAVQRLKLKQEIVRNIIEQYQSKIKKVEKQTLQEHLQSLNFPESQIMLINECISVAKRSNTHGRRYSEGWLLLCLLYKIRNPSGYNFLRHNNILPFPSPTTIYRYIRNINTKIGFDTQFFELFRIKLHSLSDLAKHGLLVLDEIQVRKSIAVNAKTLTFDGLFSENHPMDVKNMADHALVFMFTSLANNFQQPIAIFGCVGATKGRVLAQLTLQAIILLEEVGARVHGIVCDGATTNRKMWDEFGISGKIQNTTYFFENPVDSNRNIYIISDTPHLIKCIRNRLLKVTCKLKGKFINWAYYKLLYEEDSKDQGKFRIVPKLTINHIEPSNTMKMRVSLATQVFSKSVADGLKFYQMRNKRFEQCEGTIEFTLQINNMFDALNRRFPKEGVTLISNDFKVLHQSLTWLNEWENELLNGIITRQQFVTESTAEGLRVTLMSTISLITELIERFGFKYILTGKITQDCLEQFFGTLRQAGCQNDHPIFPTLLQLYRLLSIYKIVKPPKFGNCSIDNEIDTTRPFITQEEFHTIFNSKNESYKKEHLHLLKNKLDGLIETSEWECDDIIEEDYEMPAVMDCIIYYVSGFITKKMLKHISCDTCRASLTQHTSSIPDAELVNLKSLGKLKHPNIILYMLFYNAETFFRKNLNYSDVYERTVNDIILNYDFTFPCEDHKLDILSHCIYYYITMRMRQYAKQINNDLTKTSREKKKQARLYNN